MIKFFITAALILIGISCSAQVAIIKFSQLEDYIDQMDGGVKVINFWATWCGPCVKELPFIDSLNLTYPKGKVEVLLVSLDFVNQEERVNKFLDRKNIISKVWLLDETDANMYIDKVDPSWSGAIPATLLIQSSTGKRIFLEKELTKEELHLHVKKLLN